MYFSGKEILNGKGYHGWTSHFWPPLFPILIGILSKLFSGFTAGKLISIVSSALLLYVSYDLSITLTGNIEIAILTQVFLLLSPLFFRESLQAHNHMLDAMLFISGTTLFIKFFTHPSPLIFIAIGIVCGLSGLTRFTSYALLALPSSFFFYYNIHDATILAISFWVGFSIISFPWWIYNFLRNGSPIYNWDHLNVHVGVIPNEYGTSLHALFQCADQSNLNSIIDIIRSYPQNYIRNIYRNLRSCFYWLMKSAGVMAPFVIPGFFQGFFSLQTQNWLILYGILTLYILVISQAYVSDYYLLSCSPIITVISIIFLLNFLSLFLEEYPKLINYHFRDIIIILLLIAGLIVIMRRIKEYLRENQDGLYYLADLKQVTQALISYDPIINTKVIMAIDPIRAYYAGSKFLSTPLVYGGDVKGLVSYQGMGDRIKKYAPKYPADMEEENLRADYIIYTRTPEDLPTNFLHDLPQYKFLLEPKSKKIPDNFSLIYESSNVVAYEVKWDKKQL